MQFWFCYPKLTFFCPPLLSPLPFLQSSYNDFHCNKFGMSWRKVQSWVLKCIYSSCKIQICPILAILAILVQWLLFVINVQRVDVKSNPGYLKVCSQAAKYKLFNNKKGFFKFCYPKFTFLCSFLLPPLPDFVLQPP